MSKKEMNFGQKALMPFLFFILFSALFAGLSLAFKADTSTISNSTMKEIFTKWSMFAGIPLAFLSMLGMYIVRLFGLKKIRFAGSLLLILGALPWLLFGYDLVYLEPRYASVAIAIIDFLGKPMFYSSLIIAGLGIFWLLMCVFVKSKKSHVLKVLAMIIAPLFLNGCLGDLMEISCMFMDDPAHCYQSAAVQNADPYGCEKVQGEGFTSSNPPQDKCYMMIAQNTGDYDACDYIKGGPMSYTKEDCIFAVATQNEDPSGCKMLTGMAFENCKHDLSQTITTEKLSDIAQQIEDAKSALGRNPDDPELKKQLADLEAEKKGIYEFVSPEVQASYLRENRERIMEFLDDDVKSNVAQQFTDYRKSHPNEDLDSLIKKMEEIKEDQEYVKRLDDQVNEVFDEMKGSITDLVKENIDEATGASEFAEEMQDRGLEWFKENGGDRVKTGIANLEWAKEKYDKASEQYAQITAQIDKLKKAYDEAAAVYKKIDDVNRLVAEGKLDKGKAEVLHGAILLGKGLEYATGYIPVFGSTASKITAATFEATTKFATKRAQRTTAIDKCIEDPEHCDPNGISGY